MQRAHRFLKRKSSFYKEWHTHAGHSFLHFVIFIAVALFCTGQIMVSARDIAISAEQLGLTAAASDAFLPPAKEERVKTYTNRLLKLVQEREQAHPTDQQRITNEIKNLVRERRNFLTDIARTNPQAFRRVALPENVVKKLPSDIQDDVEQNTLVKGDLTIVHGENFETGEEAIEYQIKDQKTKKTYRFHATEQEEKKLRTGQTVTVTGTTIGDELVGGAAGESTTVSTNTTLTGSAVQTGTKKVLVIPTTFTDVTAQSWTKQQISDQMFGTGANSAASYYTTISGGMTTLTGTVTDWVSIPYPSSGCTDMTTRNNWATAAEALAASAGHNVASYDRIMYVFPSKSAYNYCPSWSGWGTYGGMPARVWIFGYNDSRLYVHEQGHNYMMNHAQSLSCGTAQIGTSCTASEYGDNFDPMGYPWTTMLSMNAAHLIEAGWLPTSQIQTVTTSGTYTIAPLTSGGTAVKALRIAKPNTNEYYIIDYRQNMGRDTGILSSVTTGAMIRVWAGGVLNPTKLVPIVPDSNKNNDALTDGMSFTDSTNNIVVTQLSHGSSSVVLNISLAAQQAVCTRGTQTVTVTPTSQSATPGTKLNYSVIVKNNDSVGCTATTFALGTQAPTGWVTSISPTMLSLTPGSSLSSVIGITPTTTTLDGSYSALITVSDSTNNHPAVSSSVTYVVFTPIVVATTTTSTSTTTTATSTTSSTSTTSTTSTTSSTSTATTTGTTSGDTTVPSITITSPKNGLQIRTRTATSSTSFGVFASDAGGISKIELYIGTSLVKTCTSTTSCSTQWIYGDVAAGKYDFVVKAYDRAGNMGTKTASVTVR